MTRLPVGDRPRFRAALVAAVAALIGFSTAAHAQVTYTWTGGATPNGSWATAANWDANGVPVDDLINTNVVLTGGTNLLTNVNLLPAGGLFNLNSLVFNASAGGFTVNPTGTNVTTLRLGGGGISVASNATQNVVVPLALGANQTWANTGTGVTNVRGAVTATGQTLTFGGTGAINVTGAITGGTVTKTGTGATTLAGNNTLAALNVNAGTVVVNQAAVGSNPLGSGTVTLGGGTLSFRAFGNPLAVSGFNHDAITSVTDFASGAATGYGTSRAIDGADGNGGFVYYERGANAAQPTQGVPVGGQFTGTTAATSNNTYQLGDYGAGGVRSNNVLSLGAPGGANGSGTLTLTAPGQYRTLSIMNATGSGNSVYSFTLNFADGSNTTVTGNASPDWFNGADAITLVILGGRMNRGSGAFENNGNNPRIYGQEYTLSTADSLKTLNSITFTTTTNGGTLNIFGASGLSGASTQTYANALSVTANSTVDQVNVPNIVVGPLAVNGSTLSFTNNGTSTFTAGAVTLSGNPTFNTAAGTTFFAGAIDAGGAARTLTKSGAGVMTLTAAATSFGAGSAVNVSGGTLNANAAGAVGTQAAVNVSAGATLGLGASQTVASLTGANGSTVALGGNSLTVNGGTATTFAGRITGSAGSSLVVGGAGTVLNLTGGANTPASTVLQAGAKLTASAPQALGAGAVTLNDNATLAVGGLQGVSVTGFNSGTGWNLQGNQIGNPPAQQNPTATATALTIMTDVNGTLGSFQGAAARSAWRDAQIPVGVSFTASFRYSQQTFVSASGSDPASGATFAIQAATPTALGGTDNGLGYSGITNSAAFAININGSAGNRGIAVLTNGGTTNTYLNTNTGANPIDFQFANAANSGPVTVNLTYNADTNTLGGTLQQGTFTQALPNVVINLASVVGSLGRLGFTAGTTVDRSAQMVIDNFTYTSAGAAVYTAPVSVADAATSTVNVITTTAPTIFMGTLAMGNGSTLRTGAEAGGPANSPYTLTFGATTLNLTGTFNVQNNGTGGGTVTLGAVSGADGSLVKTGAGTLVLGAASNTYAAATVVQAGRLLVNGTLTAGGGAVTVQSGGTLGGTGTISRGVVVEAGGAVNGGNGATAANQTLTLTAPLTFTSGGALRAVTSGIGTGTTNVNTTTAAASRVVAGEFGRDSGSSVISILLVSDTGANALTLNGTVTYTRRLATYTTLAIINEGTYLSTDANSPFAVAGQQFDPGAWRVIVGNDAGTNRIDVVFTPVPEPTTVLSVAAVGMGLAGLVRRLRRRPVEAATAA